MTGETRSTLTSVSFQISLPSALELYLTHLPKSLQGAPRALLRTEVILRSEKQGLLRVGEAADLDLLTFQTPTLFSGV